MLQTAAKTRSETHGKFIWCELMTSDTTAAGTFYSAVIGWKISEIPVSVADPGETGGVEDMPYFLFEMGEGDDCPGIGGMMHFPLELQGKLPPNWTGYVAVDDVDETCREYVALGGGVQREAADIPGIGRFAVVADPHGAVLCIMTPVPPETPPRELGPDDPGNVGWRELHAGQVDEAFDFHAEVFGWTKDHDFDMGEMGPYRIFSHGGRAVGGMMTRLESVPMPCWFYYFNVEAIDAAIERIKAAGGAVVNGPMEVPGESWIVQATDPQGAFFCLLAPKR